MRAIILAGGSSKKLSPFSNTRPKCMIPIAGIPILETMLLQLHKNGIEELLLVVNHKKHYTQDAFQNLTSPIKITWVEQTLEEGIGNAIQSCSSYFTEESERFILLYGDVLTVPEHFRQIMVLSRSSAEKKFLAAITHPMFTGSYGRVYLNTLNNLLQISEVIEDDQFNPLEKGNYILAGCYVFDRQIFSLLQACDSNMLEVLKILASQNKLSPCIWEEDWIDIVYPWHILSANRFMMNIRNTSHIRSEAEIAANVTIEGRVHIGKNTKILPGASITGQCYIGDNVQIGNNCLIRENAVIGSNTIIGYGTEIKNSILFGNNTIDRLSFIGDSVVGEGVCFRGNNITINRHADGKKLTFKHAGKEIDTKLEKLGAFIGDYTNIGANNVLSPAHVIAPNTSIPDQISPL